MRQSVILLLVCSVLISFSGCADKCAPVVQKCIVPDVPYPEINSTIISDINLSSRRALKNYEAMKAYAESLRVSLEACR